MDKTAARIHCRAWATSSLCSSKACAGRWALFAVCALFVRCLCIVVVNKVDKEEGARSKDQGRRNKKGVGHTSQGLQPTTARTGLPGASF